MKPVGLAFIVMLPLCIPAAAEDLPRFDIRVFCAANADARGGQSVCQRREQAARVTMVQRWEDYPKQRKHFCVQSVSFQRRELRSYVDLAGCLDESTTS